MLQTLVLQLQALEPCADPDMHQNTVDSDVEQSRRATVYSLLHQTKSTCHARQRELRPDRGTIGTEPCPDGTLL